MGKVTVEKLADGPQGKAGEQQQRICYDPFDGGLIEAFRFHGRDDDLGDVGGKQIDPRYREHGDSGYHQIFCPGLGKVKQPDNDFHMMFPSMITDFYIMRIDFGYYNTKTKFFKSFSKMVKK